MERYWESTQFNSQTMTRKSIWELGSDWLISVRWPRSVRSLVVRYKLIIYQGLFEGNSWFPPCLSLPLKVVQVNQICHKK